MAFRGYQSEEKGHKFQDKWGKVAQSWLLKGFTPDVVANGVWNKTGLLSEAKNGTVYIQYAKRTLEVTEENITITFR